MGAVYIDLVYVHTFASVHLHSNSHTADHFCTMMAAFVLGMRGVNGVNALLDYMGGD